MTFSWKHFWIACVAMLTKYIFGFAAVALCNFSFNVSVRADCFEAAAGYQRVNPWILRAIAWKESRYLTDATHRNMNGSTDYGIMQINSIHLPELYEYGISEATLMEPCKNIYIAAWYLRQKMNKYGNTWDAIGSYHSETPSLRNRYAQQIEAIVNQWKLQPPEQ